MILSKRILDVLDKNGELTLRDLDLEINDPRTKERMKLLLDHGEIERIKKDQFRITEKGKKVLRKLL
ncbi:hypothetical protein [Ammoniphilus sp. YIM 78166]|uniref:hypothetical protein n=1 Tax=Ammoniphilus sp. YIM 78166 TaxID=1644106 RepID=UPI00106FA1B0|nr:hypothetical protein [Ammoniphilus sp. YIM 78166]